MPTMSFTRNEPRNTSGRSTSPHEASIALRNATRRVADDNVDERRETGALLPPVEIMTNDEREIERMRMNEDVHVVDFRKAVRDNENNCWRVEFRWALNARREGYQTTTMARLAQAVIEHGVVDDASWFSWKDEEDESAMFRRTVCTVIVRLEEVDVERFDDLHQYMLDGAEMLNKEDKERLRAEKRERVAWWASGVAEAKARARAQRPDQE